MKKTTGDRIREILDQRGMQAKDLAFGIGISEQALSNYILNKRNITSEMVVKIADFLNVTTDSLLRDVDTSNELEEIAYMFNQLDDDEKQAILLTLRKFTNKR